MLRQDAIDQLREMLGQLRDIRRDGLLDTAGDNAAYSKLVDAGDCIREAVNHLVVQLPSPEVIEIPRLCLGCGGAGYVLVDDPTTHTGQRREKCERCQA